ncbi:UNVERIFIED_CONTAM: hypothetical protein Sradi_3342100 [Sesamum radiatum]|uniref:Uncharacterized protein n=1 Tax=Sesamum radiatum TaxID=300843 RepID=A0AAW2R365_SESRA
MTGWHPPRTHGRQRSDGITNQDWSRCFCWCLRDGRGNGDAHGGGSQDNGRISNFLHFHDGKIGEKLPYGIECSNCQPILPACLCSCVLVIIVNEEYGT